MKIIKLNLDTELLREQTTMLAQLVHNNYNLRHKLNGVVILLEEIADQAEGIQTPALTALEQEEPLAYQGVPIVWDE